MSRPQRIEFKGAYYPVMNGAVGRGATSARDAPRSLFFELLGETKDMFGVDVIILVV